MSEILFKCPGCAMNLCANDSAAGSGLTCPSCQGQIVLPKPDFSFNCPSCRAQHLVPAGMANESFQCPACNNALVIPTSGVKYFRPLKSRPKSIVCPSCSSLLEVDDRVFTEMAGQNVECPMCKGKITIPMLLSKKSLLRPPSDPVPFKALAPTPAPAPMPVTVPMYPSATGCPGCKTQMPPNAVICTACGLDLRTGQKIAMGVSLGVNLQEEKKESRLKFKDTGPKDQSLHPALGRHAFSRFTTWQGMVMWFTINSTMITIANILAIIAAIFAVLYFVDFGNSEGDSWKTAVQSIRILKSQPSNEKALESLKGVIPKISNGVTGHTPKSGLMAVWALGQLELGNVDKGVKICELMQKNYGDTSFAPAFASTNFTQTCPQCQGSRPPCAACGGHFTCQACEGKGSKAFASGMANSSHQKVHRLGDPSLGVAVKPLKQLCTSCNGTGKCLVCKGTGKALTNCTGCSGKGSIFSKTLVHERYAAVVRQVYPYAVGKMLLEKLLDVGIRLQEILKITRTGHEQPPSDEIPDTDVLDGAVTPAAPAVDWDKRYQELYRICTEKFVAPKLQEHIAVRIDGGNVQEGTLVSLTDSNLEIRVANVNATIGLQNTQLDRESRVRCFRDDYATFFAGKKCASERAEAAKLAR